MKLQRIDDSNYREFINGNAVLILTLSYCPYCHGYMNDIEPVIEEEKVEFGEAVMDLENVEEIENNIKMPSYYPTAILFKNGKEVARLKSRAGNPTTKEELIKAIKENF